jgi:hypothetical protein
MSPILTMPNAFLFGISVVLSGAIGSVFVAFHFRQPDIVARLFMGTVAGLVALLVLKGGKYLFIVNAGLVVHDNPYAGAFAGILAGLFTERGFQLIEHLVDSTIDRVKSNGLDNDLNHEPRNEGPVPTDQEPKEPADPVVTQDNEQPKPI